MAASSFTWLCIAMHAAIAALLVFIYQVMLTFSSAIQGMTSGESEAFNEMTSLPSFTFLLGGSQLELLNSVTIVVIIVLTVANAVAIKVTGGGHGYKYLFFLSITLAISGICFIFIPDVVTKIFGSLPPMG
jgi:archaellum biogenesis protein FlaJ (TadC family)